MTKSKPINSLGESAFKAQFITNFLSTWVAINYEKLNDLGLSERLCHPPVEDSEYLAQTAWEEWKDYSKQNKD